MRGIWRRLLLAVAAAGLLCLLAACNQAQVPESVQPDDGQEAVQAEDQDRQEESLQPIEEQPVSTGEWFNDDWRDAFPPQRHDGPNMVYGDLVHKEDITMQVAVSYTHLDVYKRQVLCLL